MAMTKEQAAAKILAQLHATRAAAINALAEANSSALAAAAIVEAEEKAAAVVAECRSKLAAVDAQNAQREAEFQNRVVPLAKSDTSQTLAMEGDSDADSAKKGGSTSAAAVEALIEIRKTQKAGST